MLLCFSPLHAQERADTTRAAAGVDQSPTHVDSLDVGYGMEPATHVTGAVTKVRVDRLERGPIVTPERLLQGRIAGVEVLDDNEPGGPLAVRIRGVTSLVGGSNPLYVVDGMPIGVGSDAGLSDGRDPLDFLDPEDIASITVLEDAGAAAIYGINGATGVIVVTTKSGRGEPRLEYRGTVSSSSVTRFPAVLNATQYRAAVARYDAPSLGLLGSASTDWYSQVSGPAFGQEHELSVSGSGAGHAYRLSLGYLRRTGVLQASSTERLSLGLHYDQRLFTDHLTVRLSVRGAQLHDRFTPDGTLQNAARMGPTQPVRDPTSATGYYNWPGNGLASPDNPVELVNLAKTTGTVYRSVGNVRADYRLPPLPGLRIHVNLGYDAASVRSRSLLPGTLHSESVDGIGGELFDAKPHQTNTVFEGYLTYRTPPGFLPGRIHVTGGYSHQQSHTVYPSTHELGLDTTTPVTETFRGVQDSKLNSFFGRVRYELEDRYFVTLSMRHDHNGATRLGGTFPSVSVAWWISREPFMRRRGPLSALKLRASWGRVGDQDFASQVLSSAPGPTVDPNLKLEETTEYDVGLDFGLLGGRVAGSADWYSRTIGNLIATIPVAAGTTPSYLTTNVGRMRNRGLDLSLRAKLLSGSSRVGWTAQFTASRNANEVTSLAAPNGLQVIPTGAVAGASGTSIQVLEAGQPANSFYVCRQYYQNGSPVEGAYLTAGGNRVAGCGYSDRRSYHDPAPSWVLGHTSYFTYEGWELSFTLRAYLGNWIYNNTAAELGNYQALTFGPPSNLSASVLRTGFVAPQYLSDYYVQDGAFLRMDDVGLSYGFTWHSHPMRLYGDVQNAFTVTGYGGADPAAAWGGVDSNLYPPARTVTAGLRAGL